MKQDIPLSKIMTTDIITVNPHQTMNTVKEIFDAHNIHHIPVISKRKVVGMISKIDFFKIQHGISLFKDKEVDAYNNAILRSLFVSEVMTKQVAKLSVDDTIGIAVSMFKENFFHAIPIVDKEGNIAGIVTTFDLLNYAFSNRMNE